MDQPGSSQPPPSSSTTENPIVAVGRKVKSVLKPTKQRPSIRILRENSSAGQPRRAPLSSGIAEKPLPSLPPQGTAPESESRDYEYAAPAEASRVPSKENSFANRFADARNRAGASVRSLFGREDAESDTDDESLGDEYDAETVDLMDVVDPEVATLSTLTNVQNSLFVPSFGRFLNRRPTYRIVDRPGEAGMIDKLRDSLKRISKPEEGDEKVSEPEEEGQQTPSAPRRQLTRTSTIPSTLTDSRYAVLPYGETLEGWTHEEKEELDDLVRHQLHSRRARSKRAMKGFWQYVRRPLGLFVTVYATLITLFGAAWVLFLIGWISIGSKRDYVINIVDNVLVALFAIIGDGLAPFRAVDTYHMIYIAHYHRKTWKKRDRLGLPKLVDHNDLPEQRRDDIQPVEVDLESLVARKMPRGLAKRIAPRIPKRYARRMVTRSKTNDSPSYEYSVLTPQQQAKLDYHERKFSKSHTFYKPHETETHFAFPLKLLVAVVILLDCHSALQISLGACTWGIPYKTRPFALTTVILCCSITCNIMGGVLISMGDKRTRKKDVIERMMRQELTSDAIEQMETRRLKEAEERGEIDKSVRKRIEDERDEAENEEIKKSWKVVPALPKKLLGKGEDHRQPALPQHARKSSSHVESSASGSSAIGKSKGKSASALPPVQEDPVQPSLPKPVLRGAEPPKEGKGQKVMRLIRRADFDRS